MDKQMSLNEWRFLCQKTGERYVNIKMNFVDGKADKAYLTFPSWYTCDDDRRHRVRDSEELQKFATALQTHHPKKISVKFPGYFNDAYFDGSDDETEDADENVEIVDTFGEVALFEAFEDYEFIYLENMYSADRALDALLCALRRSTVKHFRFRPCVRGSNGHILRSVFEALPLCLTTLDLWNVNFSQNWLDYDHDLFVHNAGAAMDALGFALLHFPVLSKIAFTLHSLYDHENEEVTKDACAALNLDILCGALQKNTSVTFLQLFTHMGDRGVCAIAKALTNNRTLKHLDLGGNAYLGSGHKGLFATNYIGDDGALAIAELLERNDTLQELLLSDNLIGQKGGIAIAESLKMNKSLQYLDVRRNRFKKSSKATDTFCDAMNFNEQLFSLILFDNFQMDEWTATKSHVDGLVLENVSVRKKMKRTRKTRNYTLDTSSNRKTMESVHTKFCAFLSVFAKDASFFNAVLAQTLWREEVRVAKFFSS